MKLLEISDEEQKEMRTIIDDEEYKRRRRLRNNKAYENKLKKEGKLTEKEKISQRRKKIKDLLDKGLSQKEIYLSLNISKRTCINDIKYLKEQGLI